MSNLYAVGDIHGQIRRPGAPAVSFKLIRTPRLPGSVKPSLKSRAGKHRMPDDPKL